MSSTRYYWKFAAENWDGDRFYLDADGVAASEDEAFAGTPRQADMEADRRADLYGDGLERVIVERRGKITRRMT